ncbi:36822_t:CDS:2, partial [Gigaspora margarita]
KAFHIDIEINMKVSQIKQLLINSKNRFVGKDAEELILWHVDIPTKDRDLGTTIKIEDIEGSIEMSPSDDVKKYFGKPEHNNLELITAEEILEFLLAKFEKLPGDPLITSYGHKFPFVGRSTTARRLTESFISQFKAACKGNDRIERPIFISAGAPGTGKTRNLIETIPMIRSCFPYFATNEISNEIQEISYLLDNPVQILMTYDNPLNIEKSLGASSAIGLRILHYYFASQSYLFDFIDQMIAEFGDEPLKQKLNVSMAINVIATSIRGNNASHPLLIYVALDEFQKVVGAPFCKGDSDQEKRQYLKEVTLAL